jgi:hypothetical protein
MPLAQRIRQCVLEGWIEPARQTSQQQVSVRAAAVHERLNLSNRYPAVCEALDTDLSLDQAKVTLIERHGSRLSSTVE